MMIEAFKRQDGEGLGANKVVEGSGENIPEQPKPRHKNDFPPKPNHHRNRIDTTPAPPVFPTPTNDLQKPIKFVRTSGKVFFGKESEKASEEKSVKSSGEKPSEQPQSKPKPKLVRFHCGYCGKECHKEEFCFKRKREERMAKEWANKDKYNPSHSVPKPHMPLPRSKVVVRSVPAWGDVSSRSRGVVLERAVRPAWLGGQTGPAQRGAVRPAWLGGSTAPPRILGGVVFELVSREVSVLEVVLLVVGLESQQVASLLGILPLEFTTGMGGVVAFRRRGGTIHGSPFVVLVLLSGREGWFPRSGYRGGVRGGSFGRKDGLVCANPTFEQMARH
jgi:hypothetical protein